VAAQLNGSQFWCTQRCHCMQRNLRLARWTRWHAYRRTRWRIHRVVVAQWFRLVTLGFDLLAEHFQTVITSVVDLNSRKQCFNRKNKTKIWQVIRIQDVLLQLCNCPALQHDRLAYIRIQKHKRPDCTSTSILIIYQQI